MNYWDSLAGRLFKMVFGAYLLLAILVTLVQLAIEYANVERRMAQDLASLGQSFQGSVTQAMWDLDRPLMETMAVGITQSSTVTGVLVSNGDGAVHTAMGAIPAAPYPDADELFPPFLFHRVELIQHTATGERGLGHLTIFCARSVAMNRVMHSFMVILVNSIVKTAGLWIIFYLVINKGLSRHLAKMNDVVSQIKFASESEEPIELEYPHRDELGILAESMNKMQKRLIEAKSDLDSLNAYLENTVITRTKLLMDSLNFNETILLNTPLPMGVYTSTGRCTLVNNAYAELFETTREALGAKTFEEFEPSFLPGLRQSCLEALARQATQRLELNTVSGQGRDLCLECRILPAYIHGENHLLLQFVDLTERKRLEENLRHHAYHDHLTQLPNRHLLLDRLNQAMTKARRSHAHVAVLFLDLNKFKILNDTHGHEVGDQMLVEVARRLRRCVRLTDTVARLGGDEFVVILEGLPGDLARAHEHASTVADKIHSALGKEYILGDIRHQASASIGLRLFLEDERDADCLLREADEDMYRNKHAAK